MARSASVGLAIMLVAILAIIYAEEEVLPKEWSPRLDVRPYAAWLARWVDVLAQVMILLLAMLAVSHLIKGGGK